MAALRQLLNARGINRDQQPVHGSSPTSSFEEEQRRADAKVQAMGYSQPIPDRSRISRSEDQGPRPLHSKFNDLDPQSWQHPLLRGNQGHTDSGNLGNSFDRSNSVDTNMNASRPHPMRSATETNLLRGNGMDQNGMDVDDHAHSVTSMYEENESPALSPALNKHLALQPLQTTQEPSYNSSHKTRRRSRSATATDESAYYNGNRWDGYGQDRSNKALPNRGDSLKAKQKHEAKESRSMQTLRDRQRSPTRERNGKYDPQSVAASPQSARSGPTKVAHTFSGSDASPIESSGNSIVGDSPKRILKRSRDLDYSIDKLSSMEYRQLKDESFDHIPEAASIISQHKLPDPSLPLSDRLRYVYSDQSQKDRETRARGFFASLTIDQYEECGDLLLDGFRDVMDRLKQARQQKRKAAKAMEDQIAKREEWVRRKRGVCEQELGRLKNAGTAVVKPIKSR